MGKGRSGKDWGKRVGLEMGMIEVGKKRLGWWEGLGVDVGKIKREEKREGLRMRNGLRVKSSYR